MHAALGWVFFLIAWPVMVQAEPVLPWIKADKVVVRKSERTLTLLKDGEAVGQYHVSLGGDPKGAKRRLGDMRTPVGSYIIDGRNEQSPYYKSLHISYPNAQDSARAAKEGVDPGGEITIHGLSQNMAWAGKYHRFYDWTKGCIAVTNSEMDELWRAIDDGTAIDIIE